jgi:hypothetical protein
MIYSLGSYTSFVKTGWLSLPGGVASSPRMAGRDPPESLDQHVHGPVNPVFVEDLLENA